MKDKFIEALRSENYLEVYDILAETLSKNDRDWELCNCDNYKGFDRQRIIKLNEIIDEGICNGNQWGNGKEYDYEIFTNPKCRDYFKADCYLEFGYLISEISKYDEALKIVESSNVFYNKYSNNIVLKRSIWESDRCLSAFTINDVDSHHYYKNSYVVDEFIPITDEKLIAEIMTKVDNFRILKRQISELEKEYNELSKEAKKEIIEKIKENTCI